MSGTGYASCFQRAAQLACVKNAKTTGKFAHLYRSEPYGASSKQRCEFGLKYTPFSGVILSDQ